MCLSPFQQGYAGRLLEAVEHWLEQQPASPATTQAQASVAVAEVVRAQDVQTGPEGTVALRQGVAPERRISVEDAEMRHGRKSRSQRIDGYKRHVFRDLDSRLIRAVGVTPANAPEASVTDAIATDPQAQDAEVVEFHIDRAYLSSTLVRERGPQLTIFCKAWPVHSGPHLAKTAFALDWERHLIRCPRGVEMPFMPGGVVHFPPERCASCPLRERCTASER